MLINSISIYGIIQNYLHLRFTYASPQIYIKTKTNIQEKKFIRIATYAQVQNVEICWEVLHPIVF